MFSHTEAFCRWRYLGPASAEEVAATVAVARVARQEIKRVTAQNNKKSPEAKAAVKNYNHARKEVAKATRKAKRDWAMAFTGQVDHKDI